MRVYHRICTLYLHISHELSFTLLAVTQACSQAQLLCTMYHTRAFNGDCLKVMDTRLGAKSLSLLMP